MIRLLLNGGNQKWINSIMSKVISRVFKKTLGLKSAKVEIKDLMIIDGSDNDRVLVHINGDVEMTKEELLKMIDGHLPD